MFIQNRRHSHEHQACHLHCICPRKLHQSNSVCSITRPHLRSDLIFILLTVVTDATTSPLITRTDIHATVSHDYSINHEFGRDVVLPHYRARKVHRPCIVACSILKRCERYSRLNSRNPVRRIKRGNRRNSTVVTDESFTICMTTSSPLCDPAIINRVRNIAIPTHVPAP